MGYAKKLLGETKSYAHVVKKFMNNPKRRAPRTVDAQPPEVAVLPKESGAVPAGNAPPLSPLLSSQEMSQEMSLPDLGENSQKRQPLSAPEVTVR